MLELTDECCLVKGAIKDVKSCRENSMASSSSGSFDRIEIIHTHTHICVENLDDTIRNYVVSTK